MKISFWQRWYRDPWGGKFRKRDAFELYVGRGQSYLTLFNKRLFTWNYGEFKR